MRFGITAHLALCTPPPCSSSLWNTRLEAIRQVLMWIIGFFFVSFGDWGALGWVWGFGGLGWWVGEGVGEVRCIYGGVSLHSIKEWGWIGKWVWHGWKDACMVHGNLCGQLKCQTIFFYSTLLYSTLGLLSYSFNCSTAFDRPIGCCLLVKSSEVPLPNARIQACKLFLITTEVEDSLT